MTQHASTLSRILTDSITACIDGNKGGVAVQLSGGLDSAVIQAIGDFDALYCVTFPEVDNITQARLAARGKDVVPVTFTREEMIWALPEVARLTGGNGTWSQVCQWFVCRQIAKDGARMVLTGEGADELFGGYARYRILYWLEQMKEDPHLEAYQGIIKHMFGDDFDVLVRMLARNLPIEAAYSIVADSELSGNLTRDLANIEAETGLPALLDYGEAMAKAHGLQCRFPFMAPSIVEFAAALPEQLKINIWKNKAILREVAQMYGVHPLIVHEQTKKGLFIPPDWAPASVPRWSRGWFTDLMKEAHG